ncbi:N-acyl-D-amino-acid deacylase family protein [Lutispora saccharofermentans]|uniref:Amidohydrolase family protein n=1 Tax=Lutispora saccharofermentans TaxID=3024236 RepID=A0ABT1NK69_9FIRM|nr:amidohydrolase family protein [Lutispora saccharofermentans]MCQ1530296.1 amidohydrolase family protein [Lutispora saccharofermentans]
MYDLKIVNGTIIDLKTNKEIIGDIGIKDGKIKSIGSCPEKGKVEIDAGLNIISPGFIDIHIHEEEIEDVKKTNNYFTTSKMILEGVTTVVGGNCGSNRQSIKELSDYINAKGSPVNYLSYIGHRYLRALVGNDDPYKKSSKNQIEAMAKAASISLSEGAIGVSFGLEYSPGADFEEVTDLLDLIGKKDMLLAAHYRKDAKYGIDSIKELISISKHTSIPMQISHIGSCTAFGMMGESLEIVQKAIDEGIDVSADCYPYDAFGTYIGSAVFDEGCFELWNKSYENIMLTEEPFRGVRCDESLFNRVRKEYPNMMAIAYVMNEEEVIEALQAPFVMVASDGMYRNEQGHPRGAGTFPKVLGKYVREIKKLSLAEAIRKMTLMPAERLGLPAKGKIEVGFDADIVIFDSETIMDKATFNAPALPPNGIKYVIVNGEIAVKDNIIVKGNLGRFISNKELKM